MEGIAAQVIGVLVAVIVILLAIPALFGRDATAPRAPRRGPARDSRPRRDDAGAAPSSIRAFVRDGVIPTAFPF